MTARGPNQALPGVIEWLLEPENPAVRYLALTDLLGRSPRNPQVKAARADIMQRGARVPKAVGEPRTPSTRASTAAPCGSSLSSRSTAPTAAAGPFGEPASTFLSTARIRTVAVSPSTAHGVLPEAVRAK
jgi:hypothetical protein